MMKSFLAASVLASLALAVPTPLRGADNAVALAGTIKTANVAVLRFDDSVQSITKGDAASLQPSIQAGTQAAAAVQQASNDASQAGRVNAQSAGMVQQAMTDFAIAMNKAADDLVSKRDLIIKANSGGLYLDLYNTQAGAGKQLMSTAMEDMPPRERNMAAQALASIPDGMDKVQAAFGAPLAAVAPAAPDANGGNQAAQAPPSAQAPSPATPTAAGTPSAPSPASPTNAGTTKSPSPKASRPASPAASKPASPAASSPSASPAAGSTIDDLLMLGA